MLDQGSILFKMDHGKIRPFLCIHVYKNQSGIAYDYLIAPITTSVTVGLKNLVHINDTEKIKCSYVKINNIQTIHNFELNNIRISKNKLDEESTRLVILKIIKTLHNGFGIHMEGRKNKNW